MFVWSLFLTTWQEYCIWIQTAKETNHKIKVSIFTCFFHEIKRKIFTCFLNMKLKLRNEKHFFSHFHEHIFRSSRSQMLFKIGAIKSSIILQYSELKRDSNRSASLWICYFFNNSFFIEHIQLLLLYFFKSN